MTTDIKRIFIVAAAALLGTCCNRTAETPRTQPPKNVFAKGSLLENNPNFSGEAWLEMFVTAADSMDCTVGNVTFAPGVRNNWHAHPGGQILLCTSGKGLYQEKGGAIRELHPGDVVKIAPGVIHWHGAAPGSGFTHIAVGTQVSKGPAEWFGPVSDSEYNDTEGHGNR